MRKRLLSVMCIGALLLTGCGNSNSSTNAGSSEITLESGQTLLIGKVTAISGNEVTFDVATEKQMTGGMGGMNQGGSETPSASDSESKNDLGQMNQGPPSDSTNQNQSGSGNMSNGAPGGGTPPDMAGGAGPGGDSDGGFQGGDGEMNRGNKDFSGNDSSSGRQNKTDGSSDKSSQMSGKRNRVTYETTGESKTLQIPVGTTITTLLGTKTTFNRIGASNVIKMVMEKDKDGKDVVVAVYIVQ